MFDMSSRPRTKRLGLYLEARDMAGDMTGRKKLVKGEAARRWRRGRRGYMKRTSLCEMSERVMRTTMQVVASWYFMARVKVELLMNVGVSFGAETP